MDLLCRVTLFTNVGRCWLVFYPLAQMDPNGPWAGGDETHLVPLSGGNCLSILFLSKIGAGGAGRNYFVVIGAEW